MIDILESSIFDRNNIITGVTLKNLENFLPYGFSISAGEILSNDDVENNRILLATQLNHDRSLVKYQKQVHSDNIVTINKNSKPVESDGMITNEIGIILNVIIADCCAVLVHDPVNHAIGAFHSGWRGTAKSITTKGINMMSSEYGSSVENLKVYLSPCASEKEYEVGKEVAEIFPDHAVPKDDGKYLLGINKVIYDQLISIGIRKDNIEVSNICTISDENYHSYRRDKEKSGRMSAFIGMI